MPYNICQINQMHVITNALGHLSKVQQFMHYNKVAMLQKEVHNFIMQSYT